ncbi:7TM-DISM domain-containing protein [Marinobacter sp.]|uniref:7TM-DISM domain-containing protein n=1 Tax=Marinobacter sp. TaxID=50741 RepID=UPI00356699BC
MPPHQSARDRPRFRSPAGKRQSVVPSTTSTGPVSGTLKRNYPLLDQITFWQSGQDSPAAVITGDQHPFMSREIDYRYFLTHRGCA